MAQLRMEHNPEQETTEARSQPFVVFVNDNPKPRYRMTTKEAYALLESLQSALRIPKRRGMGLRRVGRVGSPKCRTCRSGVRLTPGARSGTGTSGR
jgi:hypothetical protein